MIWHNDPGADIQAALSYTDAGLDHYVVSHRPDEHTVSWRPYCPNGGPNGEPGEHHHVGTWPDAAAAIDAAERHARGEIVESPHNPWKRPPHQRKDRAAAYLYNDSDRLEWYGRDHDWRRGSLEDGTAQIRLRGEDGVPRWRPLGGGCKWRRSGPQPHTLVGPQPFGPERAAEIWDLRGPCWAIDHAITPAESAYVHQVWRTMPGDTSWMDAFNRIRLGERHAERLRQLAIADEEAEPS